ncbi:transglutaminaseTgpA domain-containing protein [Arhodomonas aquaeolei]|uniref:transglutaminase family protein n=1 Tax=Arhodomonas aquaeolei TaxID=2369 RepID=UPI0003603A3D|nr:transglutaminaseTgpA domain-containing protein [Arhodomonas aquaeolei]
MSTISAVDRRTLFWAIALIAGVLVPHLFALPPAISTAIAALLGWRLWIGVRGYHLPRRLTRVALTAAALALVAAQFATVVGPEAGVALLTLMGALKTLEMRGRRDLRIVAYLAVFLALTAFLDDESLPMGAYLLATAWAATALLIAAGRATGAGIVRADLRTAGALTGQAVPVMLILFALFPRLPGPLWALPDDGGTGVTGISDTIRPGDLSRLSRSDEVAFRVRFPDGPPPPPGQRYWRGPVFAAYDGVTWRRGERPPRTVSVSRDGPVRTQVITLQPHRQRWLYALDLPGDVSAEVQRTPALEYLADEPVASLRRYRARSFTPGRVEPDMSARVRQRYTGLPANAHPRTRALARRLHDRAAGTAGFVDAALAWLRQRPFVYTLSPGRLDGGRIDRFLFDTRRGFCEHFASAFAVLMRAGGVPARLVAGYLGGGRPDGADYLVVRQSDAHAWVEVWLPGDGWQRIDPTVAVAPARASDGLAASVPADDPVPLMARGGDGGVLRAMRLAWEQVDVMWNRWVLTYGPRAQQGLWQRLGLTRPLTVGLGVLGALGAVAAVYALWGLHRRRAAEDPLSRAWRRIRARLLRAGIPLEAGDGPHTVARRADDADEALGAVVAALARDYVRLRYRERGDTAERAAFIHRARRFRARPLRGRR